jgi:hypothetical protein
MAIGAGVAGLVLAIDSDRSPDDLYVELGYGDTLGKVWPADKSYEATGTDHQRTLNLACPLDKEGRVRLRLMDYDSASDDDVLVDLRFDASRLQPGQSERYFLRSGQSAEDCMYDLEVELSRTA